MSTSMTFQNKTFVRPPDKGSFPLDHQGECKQFMFNYMRCLRQNKQENSKCRDESKEYLECRMQRNLMAKEDWRKLGYAEAGVEPRGSSASGDTSQPPKGQS